MIRIAIMYGLFALSIQISKNILQYTHPIFMAGSRMIIAGALLLAYQYFAPHAIFKLRRKHAWLYAKIVISGFYLAYIFRFMSLNNLSPSKLSFIYNASPIFTALFCYLLFKEPISKRQWSGLCIALIGMFIIFIPKTSGEIGSPQFFFIGLPELTALAAVACHSYSWIRLGRLITHHNYSTQMANGLCMILGGTLSFITSLALESTPLVTQPMKFLFLLALVIIVSNILAHNMYGSALKRYSPTFVSLAGFSCPLYNAVIDWYFRGEIITWHFYAATIIVFTGLYVFNLDEKGAERVVA